MITKEPRINIKDIFAGLFMGLGMLLFLIILHILAIENSGNTQDMLNTTFIIWLRIFIFLALMGIVYIIYHLLKWLVWQVQTPTWQKEQMRRNGR